MGRGKMLVSDAEFAEARRLILGEINDFAAIVAGFGTQSGYEELAALTGNAWGR